MENPNPIVYEVGPARHKKSAVEAASSKLKAIPDHFFGHDIAGTGGKSSATDDFLSAAPQDESEEDPFDAEEVFELIRHINDPEHPLTLEQLRVAQLELIDVDNDTSTIDLKFTPTIPHCSMATMIGLCIRVKLHRSLPTRFKVKISITPGKHAQEHQGASTLTV